MSVEIEVRCVNVMEEISRLESALQRAERERDTLLRRVEAMSAALKWVATNHGYQPEEPEELSVWREKPW